MKPTKLTRLQMLEVIVDALLSVLDTKQIVSRKEIQDQILKSSEDSD